MKSLIKAVLAWFAAKKIGGGKCGCIGSVVVFLIVYWILSMFF